MLETIVLVVLFLIVALASLVLMGAWIRIDYVINQGYQYGWKEFKKELSTLFQIAGVCLVLILLGATTLRLLIG